MAFKAICLAVNMCESPSEAEQTLRKGLARQLRVEEQACSGMLLSEMTLRKLFLNRHPPHHRGGFQSHLFSCEHL